MRKFITSFCLLGTIAVVGISATNAQDALQLRSRPIALFNSRVQPLHEQQVPARVSGVLSAIHVKQGDQVKEGQVLATIDDRLATIELKMKKEEATNTSTLGTAAARFNEAEASYNEMELLAKTRSASPSQVRLEKAKLDVAHQGTIDAEVKHRLAEFDMQRAQSELERHQIVSEIEGVVDLQVRQEGEAVQALDPIFRVTRTDKVRVHGSLPLRYRSRVETGMVIDVYPDIEAADDLTLQHTSEVLDVDVLPGDRVVVAACYDGTIHLWDVREGLQIGSLYGHDREVTTIASSPKAPSVIVSGGRDGTLRMWNVNEKTEMKVIDTQAGHVRDVLIHPLDAAIAFTSHDDRSIRVWNLQKGSQIAIFPTGHTNFVSSLAISSDGKFLLTAGSDQKAILWDVESRKELKRFSNRTDQVRRLGLSPDNKSFLFNSYGLLEVRSLPDGLPVNHFDSRSGAFSGIALFLPLPGLVLTAGENSNLQLWQQGKEGQFPRLVRNFSGHQAGNEITGVSFASNGSYFASSSADRTVKLWRVPTLEQIEKERTRGVISFVSPQGEAGSDSLTIHAEVENPDNVLIPGSLGTIVIYPGLKREIATLEKPQ